MKLLLKILYKLVVCVGVAITVLSMSDKSNEVILKVFAGYTAGILIVVYFDIVRVLKKLNKALKIINFDLDVIDFTKLDNFEYKGKDDLGKLIDKIKELSDVLVARVDKVNAETYKSEHDGLSGLYNRLRYLNYKDFYETCKDICVIYIDVNNLKKTNDVMGHLAGDYAPALRKTQKSLQKTNDIYGHEAGDALIIRAASKLRFFKNIGDVYRMGGDEFMVIIPNKSRKECDKLIKEWYPTVGCLNNPDEGFKCMMAYGVIYGHEDFDIDELIKEADENMYNHKVQIKIANGEDPNSR